MKCNLKGGGGKRAILCKKPQSDPSTETGKGKCSILVLTEHEAEIMQMENIFSILPVISLTEPLLKYMMLLLYFVDRASRRNSS